MCWYLPFGFGVVLLFSPFWLHEGAYGPSPQAAEGVLNTPTKPIDLAYLAVNVLDTQTRIEEKSLIWVGQKVLRNNEGAPREMGTGLYEIPPFEDLIEDERQGVRIYRFVLKPKESLKLALSADGDGNMVMKFMRIVRTDPLTPQVRRANWSAEQLRRKHIQIDNPRTEPHACFLQILGRPNFPYALTIERGPLRS